jgi:hypothetical protein
MEKIFISKIWCPPENYKASLFRRPRSEQLPLKYSKIIKAVSLEGGPQLTINNRAI